MLPPKSKKRRWTRAVNCASFSSSYAMKGLVKAFAEGRLDISDDLVFPSDTGTPIEMDNFAERVFKPLLTRAGLRKVPFTTCAILLAAC